MCSGTNPNVDLFICQDGGWLPKDNPAARLVEVAAPSPSSLDWQPPTADEYEDVEVYPGATGPKMPVIVRVADPTKWFVDGKTYRHPYGFIAKVDGVALRNLEGHWHWCHRLVITETTGDPQVGHVMYARIFAPRANWELEQ